MIKLPVDLEIEQALLSCILNANAAWAAVSTSVRAEDFADPLHGRLFAAIGGQIERTGSATPLTLIQAFQGDPALTEVSAREYLERLLGSTVAITNVQVYARAVRDLADRRSLILRMQTAIENAARYDLERSAADIVSDLSRDLSRIIDQPGDTRWIADTVETIVESLRNDLPCFPTGLGCIDRIIGGGFLPGKLYGIAARPKAGKTMLLTTIAYNLNASGCRHLYLCLEMGAEEITQRLLGRQMGMNSLGFIRQDKRSDPSFIAAAGDAALSLQKNNNLSFQANTRMGLDDIRQTIGRAALVHRVEGVIVDYLQLVTGQQRTESQAQHFDNVAQALAEAAKRYGIWVAVAAQLNKEGGIRSSEGLLNACDMTLALNKIERAPQPDRAWLEMRATRFTPRIDIGSESNPALEIDIRNGPSFRDLTVQHQMAAA